MNFYPDKINARFQNPENAGRCAESNAVGTQATFVCGAVLRLRLRIDPGTKEIREARFQTNGCGFLIAAADVLAGRISGRKLTELHGLDKDELRAQIEAELGEFRWHRAHCLELCLASLETAFADFRAKQISEFTGEQALICTCFGVSEEVIEKFVQEKQLETAEAVGEVCRAGTGCGSCQPLIREIIDANFDIFN